MKPAVVFSVGAVCGLVLTAAIWTFWKEPEPLYRRSPGYDTCIFLHNGNKDVCDALMRMQTRAN